MPTQVFLRSFEISDGKIRFKRKLIPRADRCGYIIYLPKFIESIAGDTVKVEIDLIKKVITIHL